MPTLDVPVDDALFVEIGQCNEDFAGDENDEALFDLPFGVRFHLEEARTGTGHSGMAASSVRGGLSDCPVGPAEECAAHQSTYTPSAGVVHRDPQLVPCDPAAVIEGDVVVLGIAELAEEGDLALDLANVFVVRMVEIDDLRGCAYADSPFSPCFKRGKQRRLPRPARTHLERDDEASVLLFASVDCPVRAFAHDLVLFEERLYRLCLLLLRWGWLLLLLLVELALQLLRLIRVLLRRRLLLVLRTRIMVMARLKLMAVVISDMVMVLLLLLVSVAHSRCCCPCERAVQPSPSCSSAGEVEVGRIHVRHPRPRRAQQAIAVLLHRAAASCCCSIARSLSPLILLPHRCCCCCCCLSP